MSEEKHMDVMQKNNDAAFNSTVFLSAGIILLVVSALTILTNAALLITIYKDPLKCFRNKASVLVVCLGVTDFLTGALTALYTGIFHIRLSLGYAPFVIEGVPLTKMISQFTVWSGIYIITLFSIERFVAIAFPFFYRNNASKSKLVFVCILIWVFCFFGNFLEVSGIKETTYNTIELYLFFVAPLVIVLLAYCGLYFKLNRQGKVQASDNSAERRREGRRRKRERQLAATTFLIVISFVVSYCPWFVFYWIGTACVKCLGTRWLLAGFHLSIPMLYVNSMCNPLLYVWRIPAYRQSFKVVFKRGASTDDLETEGSTATVPARNSGPVGPRQGP